MRVGMGAFSQGRRIDFKGRVLLNIFTMMAFNILYLDELMVKRQAAV